MHFDVTTDSFTYPDAQNMLISIANPCISAFLMNTYIFAQTKKDKNVLVLCTKMTCLIDCLLSLCSINREIYDRYRNMHFLAFYCKKTEFFFITSIQIMYLFCLPILDGEIPRFALKTLLK